MSISDTLFELKDCRFPSWSRGKSKGKGMRNKNWECVEQDTWWRGITENSRRGSNSQGLNGKRQEKQFKWMNQWLSHDIILLRIKENSQEIVWQRSQVNLRRHLHPSLTCTPHPFLELGMKSMCVSLGFLRLWLDFSREKTDRNE